MTSLIHHKNEQTLYLEQMLQLIYKYIINIYI